MRFAVSIIIMALCMILCSTVYGQDIDPNAGEGLRVWALFDLGSDGGQEVRIGYEGLLPDVEFAVGVVHRDAPESGVDRWPIRGYAIAHALNTDMIASMLGENFTLPKGTIYGGLFAEYEYDREEEWSGGYVIGGLVDWPGNWQTVAEYQAEEFNTQNNETKFVVGLRRAF